jgi:hypothetical protein
MGREEGIAHGDEEWRGDPVQKKTDMGNKGKHNSRRTDISLISMGPVSGGGTTGKTGRNEGEEKGKQVGTARDDDMEADQRPVNRA